MFTITVNDGGDIVLQGRLDASQVDTAAPVFDAVQKDCRVDFSRLEYISSAGLGLLLKTQKRLGESGHRLVLAGMTKLVRDVFRIARFDLIFPIEEQ